MNTVMNTVKLTIRDHCSKMKSCYSLIKSSTTSHKKQNSAPNIDCTKQHKLLMHLQQLIKNQHFRIFAHLRLIFPGFQRFILTLKLLEKTKLFL